MPRRPWAIAMLTAFLVGCAKEGARPVPDSARTTIAPDSASSPAAATSSGWDTAFGDALLASTDDGGALAIVGPGEGGVREVSLLSRSGTVEHARITGVSAADSGCGQPSVTLFPKPARPWSIGLAGTVSGALPLDSLSGLVAADSVALAAELTRLAFTIPANPASRFTGLPFAVRSADRFMSAPGVQAVAARLERGLNQEASPLVEALFLVAERDSGALHAPFTLAWHVRVEGTEDAVDAFEVLAGIAPSAGRPAALVVARDGAEGLRYMLLRRDGARRWSARFTSATSGCDER
ncbi:MAG: hypothetical protein JWO05_1835 [Gemmatimonadetes bacterium]|nr:hypothetical protein [Gemmatimonadota bacterium]